MAVQTGGTTITTSSFTDVTGDTIVVGVFGTGAFNGFVYSDGQSNSYSQKVASVTALSGGASTYFAVATVATGGSDTVTVTTGGGSRTYAIVAIEYRSVTGFGVTATAQADSLGAGTTSDTSTLTVTGSAGNGGALIELGLMGGIPSTTPAITYNNAQTQRVFSQPNGGGALQGLEEDDYAIAATSFTISSTWSWSPGCGANTCSDSRVGLELLGATPTAITTINQCYGNCGTPPITLVNTNSTHGINWNQSVTIFYEFQPTISGFLKNITTNLAKTYPNGFYAPLLGFYQSTCALGQTPFSSQCPATALLGAQTTSNNKGRQSINGGIQYTVVSKSNVWYGVALSFNIAPEDVNDTNSQVQLFQTTGTMPATITSSSVLNSVSKIGIWAWITGNVIGTLPPPTPSTSGCTGIIDCILPQLAQSLCTNPTAGCVNAGGLVELVGLVLVSLFFVVKTAASSFPNMRLPVGELILFFGVIWVFILTGANILFIWVPILIFFLVSLFMQKQTTRILG